MTELDASSHTYDETDTDLTTTATLDEDIDRTISFFADGTISTVDNSTSNSGSTTTETVTAAGFWSVTFQGATTSGSYGTLSNPTSTAYLLALGSSASGGSASGSSTTTFANRTDSSAALSLAVQQSGLSVTAPTGLAGGPLNGPSGNLLADIANAARADWLNAFGLGYSPAGEPDLANALAWPDPPGRAGTFNVVEFAKPAYKLVVRPNFGSLTIGPETREFAIANPALFNDYFTKYGAAGIARLDAFLQAAWTVNPNGNSWDWFGLGWYHSVDAAETTIQIHGGMTLADQTRELHKALNDPTAKVAARTGLSHADQATALTGARSADALLQARASNTVVFNEVKIQVATAATGQLLTRLAIARNADNATSRSGSGTIATHSADAPNSVDWLADAMKGWKNGDVIPESVLKRLSGRLNRNKVSVIQNEWALEILEKSGDGAQFVRFKDGSAGLLLRPNATRYQIVHELKHYEHWLADPKKYGTLSKLEREEFVFKALQESNHWPLFNDAERAHALEYIEYLRKLYGN